MQRFLLMKASKTVFRNIFWYCFVKRYQLAQPRTLRTLAKNIGMAYAGLVSGVNCKNHSLKDFLFTMFPFALSFSVTSMFHYLLPSTRNLYSAAGWKTGIWLGKFFQIFILFFYYIHESLYHY